MDSTPDGRLLGLLKRWDDVEGSIKRAELFQGQVTIPAVNELRYAGRQIIKAVAVREATRAQSVASELEHRGSQEISNTLNVQDADYLRALSNAEQYVMNADHDVVDGVIVFVSLRIAELNFRFGRDAIAKRSPKYGDYCKLVAYCKGQVEMSRRVNSRERSSIYAELKVKHLDALMDRYEDVTNSEAIMAAELEAAKQDRDKKSDERDAARKIAARRLIVIFSLIIVILSMAIFVIWNWR